MDFNDHSPLKGLHAFLSASNSHWVGYSHEKLDSVFLKSLAIQRGTELHELASRCIQLGVKLPKSRKSFDRYVNDAIGYRMTPEQVLYYSPNCFGTADAISFSKGVLRIHDLKTGVVVTNMRQLEVYTALFCLEYDVSPLDIEIELRKYQFDEITILVPEVDDIRFIMDRIIEFDRRIQILKMEG
jgi:hypothetical protein